MPDPQTVRRHLQRVTHDTHAALHHDPVLRQLSNPGLRAGAYDTALSVFAVFYEAIERTRILCGVSDRFAVQRECAALSADLGKCRAARQSLGISDPLGGLGALYVAHGAAFGRNTFRKNVTCCLPNHPTAFVNLEVERGTWSALLAELDAQGATPDGRRAIQVGAERAFSFMQEVARRAQPLLVSM